MNVILSSFVSSTLIALMLESCSGEVQQSRTCSNPINTQVTSQGEVLQAQSVTAILGETVIISSVVDACARLYDTAPSEETSLQIFLNRASQPGIYPVVLQWIDDPTAVGAMLAHAPENGVVAPGFHQPAPDIVVNAVGGSVVLTRLDNNEIAGSFDILFPDGAHAVGTFDTPYCRAGNVCPVTP